MADRPRYRSRSRSPPTLHRGEYKAQLPSYAAVFLNGIQFTLWEMGRMIRLMLGVIPPPVYERLVNSLLGGMDGTEAPLPRSQQELEQLHRVWLQENCG